MLPRKTSGKESIPVWGWWVIGGFLAAIFLVWFVLSGAIESAARASVGLVESLFGLVLIAFLVLLYFLPSGIAAKSPRAAAVFLTNLIFGWTGIGWIIALIWAVADAGTVNARKNPPPYR